MKIKSSEVSILGKLEIKLLMTIHATWFDVSVMVSHWPLQCIRHLDLVSQTIFEIHFFPKE